MLIILKSDAFHWNDAFTIKFVYNAWKNIVLNCILIEL